MFDCNACPFYKYEQKRNTNGNSNNYQIINHCFKCQVKDSLFECIKSDLNVDYIVQNIISYSNAENIETTYGEVSIFIEQCILTVFNFYICKNIQYQMPKIIEELIKEFGKETLLKIIPECPAKTAFEISGTVESFIKAYNNPNSSNYDKIKVLIDIFKLLHKYCSKRKISFC